MNAFETSTLEFPVKHEWPMINKNKKQQKNRIFLSVIDSLNSIRIKSKPRRQLRVERTFAVNETADNKMLIVPQPTTHWFLISIALRCIALEIE